MDIPSADTTGRRATLQERLDDIEDVKEKIASLKRRAHSDVSAAQSRRDAAARAAQMSSTTTIGFTSSGGPSHTGGNL